MTPCQTADRQLHHMEYFGKINWWQVMTSGNFSILWLIWWPCHDLRVSFVITGECLVIVMTLSTLGDNIVMNLMTIGEGLVIILVTTGDYLVTTYHHNTNGPCCHWWPMITRSAYCWWPLSFKCWHVPPTCNCTMYVHDNLMIKLNKTFNGECINYCTTNAALKIISQENISTCFQDGLKIHIIVSCLITSMGAWCMWHMSSCELFTKSFLCVHSLSLSMIEIEPYHNLSLLYLLMTIWLSM